jgi:enoyl-CoA hydratase
MISKKNSSSVRAIIAHNFTESTMSIEVSIPSQAAEDLLVEQIGATLLMTFNRPASRNALTFAMYEGMAKAIQVACASETIKVVVITGAGDKAFAAGTDISQFKAFANAQDAIAYEHSISKILAVLETCSIPTIAAVAGACTGGGFGIAACCDVRLCTSDAKFGVPIARTLGNCLSLSTHARLADLLGIARVKDLIITSRLMDANEMRWAGVVSEVLPDATQLRTRALALAEQIAGQAPLSMLVTKESLLALQPPIDPQLEEALFLKAYLSQDFAEGVAAFLEKRRPQWTGR